MVMFTFSVLDLLEVLSKESIGYFDITWLISQQFTGRDIKPAAYLFPFKIGILKNEDLFDHVFDSIFMGGAFNFLALI